MNIGISIVERYLIKYRQKVVPSSVGLAEGLTTPHYKKTAC
jgi:hypothetical protein